VDGADSGFLLCHGIRVKQKNSANDQDSPFHRFNSALQIGQHVVFIGADDNRDEVM
jgi:hypothetical protein